MCLLNCGCYMNQALTQHVSIYNSLDTTVLKHKVNSERGRTIREL